jgi:hypothetical protein
MAHQDQTQNPHKPYWMLTLSLAIALTRAALDWGGTALSQLVAIEVGAVQDPQPSKGNPANKA